MREVELTALCKEAIAAGKEHVLLTRPYRGRGRKRIHLFGRLGPLGETLIMQEGYCVARYKAHDVLKALGVE